MKKLRFTYNQILAILKQVVSGILMPLLYREHSMNSAMFYKWRSEYDGMHASLITKETAGVATATTAPNTHQ